MFKRIVIVFIAMTTLAACAGTKTAKVTGTVTYLQRIALPENAVVKVTLEDISKADAAAVVLGEQEIKTAGKSVPFAFEISYNPAEIVTTHTYNLRATISDAEGELLFSSDTATLVITNGAPTEGIEIIVKPAGASATAALAGPFGNGRPSNLRPNNLMLIRRKSTLLSSTPKVMSASERTATAAKPATAWMARACSSLWVP